jgi:hypothetical protein
MNFDSSYQPELTAVGIVFRSLLRAHILRKLRINDMLIPGKLLLAPFPNLELRSGNKSALYTDVEKVFEQFVGALESRSAEGVANYMRGWPLSKTELDGPVARVIEEVLANEVPNWGHVAALVVFITQLALNCARYRLHDAIIPLINYTAECFDQRLTGFVRSNGGWVGFAHVFGDDDHASPWVQTVASFLAGALGLGALAVLASVYLR